MSDANAAVFFDLDRTLLRGASGPLINEALVTAGLVPDRRVPGQGLLYRIYDLIGETLPTMALARGAALLSRGWTASAVREAAEVAADRLEHLVAPYARPLLDEHRQAGRLVVLATTTPDDLIRPFAERLKFDDVIATRYARAGAEDGGWTYTGGLEGEFVWARGKLAFAGRTDPGEGGAKVAGAGEVGDPLMVGRRPKPTGNLRPPPGHNDRRRYEGGPDRSE